MKTCISTVLAALGCLLTGSAVGAQKLDGYRLVHDAALGLPVLASPLPADVRLLASTDPQRQNKDYLLLAPQEQRTAATLKGPALVLRLWFTSSVPEKTTVLMRVDGKAMPLLRQGKPTGYPPVKALGGVHEKAFFSYYPLRVRQALQLHVVNGSDQENKFFFQINYQSISDAVAETTTPAPRWQQLGQRIEKESRHPTPPSPTSTASGTVQCSPQQETPLPPLTGPGVLRYCALTPTATEWRALEKVYLLIRWDDEKQPSVIAPLSWLFGQYFERGQIQSTLLYSDGKSFTLRFPMPFERSAKFSMWNGHAAPVTVDWSVRYEKRNGAVPPYRFCATAAAQTTERGKPFLLLDAQGEGVLVGCTVGLQGGEMNRTLSFLEGNERIEVDDNPQKTLEGTGAEDFFNSAWFFPPQPFSFPFHGMTFKGVDPQRVSAYRLMLTDRVPFKKRLRLTLQHGGRNSSPGCLYRAVTFWYQKAPRHFAPRPDPTAATPSMDVKASLKSERQAEPLLWILGAMALVIGAFFFYRLVDKRKRAG
ncbi:MAG: DUF2961 domain-containing protein [Abditibacteriales bacterium]|nr:DUF2961 domain-containing protein [Abditibacteriales bacterium]MDW8366299.1 glycoside hydrolase family 172 protein [Abditibacteriales bacterium]